MEEMVRWMKGDDGGEDLVLDLGTRFPTYPLLTTNLGRKRWFSLVRSVDLVTCQKMEIKH